MNSKVVLIVLLILSAGFSGYLLYDRYQLEGQIEELEELLSESDSLISTLRDDISNLKEQVDWLESDIGILTTVNIRLEGQVNVLNVEVNTLRYEKRELESDLVSLQSDYQELYTFTESLADSYQIEKELRIGNSLESYYDSVREGLGPTGAQYWWFNPQKNIWQTKVEFATKLAQHDLWRIYWTAYEDEYKELTGENSYETAWNKINTILSFINISYYDPPDEKISKILNFLNEHIHYEVEVNDIFLAPVETLGFKSGDCDDYSILAAALFECVSIESAIGFFKNDQEEYHAMVLVNIDDLGGYRYWYYDDLTELGLDEGQWIKIEPQTTIEEQGSDEWMGQWTILVAAQIEN